jgi:transposase
MGKKLYGKRHREEYLAQLSGKHAAARLVAVCDVLGADSHGAADRARTDAACFRTKRQFWTYCGLGLETRDSGEYRVVHGQVERQRCDRLREGGSLLKMASRFGMAHQILEFFP